MVALALDSKPNAKKTNNILTAIRTYITTFLFARVDSIKQTYMNLRNNANAVLSQIYLASYYLWSNKMLLRPSGIHSSRAGFTEGKTAILAVVYIVVAFLVATILFPMAENQVTSAVTTSWNPAVAVSYTTLLPVLVIIALVLHFLGAF